MLTDQEISYYKRQLALNQFGLEAQEKLKEAKILVVGAGGLGCPALQYLTGAGIGKVGIVDGDVVSVHNLHRQLLFDIDTSGIKKTIVAKERLKAINPFIEIELFSEFLTPNNAHEIIQNFDIVLDCSDNFETRYLINDVCILQDKPFVYGSVFRYEGQISVFNFKNGPTYRCLFPSSDQNATILNCNDDGVLGVLPGIIGTYQAMEAIKLISGIGTVLSGKLLLVNMLNNQFNTLSFERKNIPYKETISKHGLELAKLNCQNILINELDYSDLDQMDNYIFLDVRNFDEKPRFEHENVIEIPLNELHNKIHELPVDKNIICVCKSGKRSQQASKLLSGNFVSNIYNLKNGLTNEFIQKWKKQ